VAKTKSTRTMVCHHGARSLRSAAGGAAATSGMLLGGVAIALLRFVSD